MDAQNIFLVSPIFSWVLMFWILIPFLIRPLIKNKALFRKPIGINEVSSTIALWNAYIIACWLLLPILLVSIKPQVSLSVQLLCFLAISWWLRVLIEFLQRKNIIPTWKYLGLAHHGVNLLILLVGISFVQAQLNSYVPIANNLEIVGAAENPIVEAADWLAYCFLVCATLITSLQFYIEFIRVNSSSTDDKRKNNLVQKLDLASISVGFSHLCFQTSLLLFVNLQLLF